MHIEHVTYRTCSLQLQRGCWRDICPHNWVGLFHRSTPLILSGSFANMLLQNRCCSMAVQGGYLRAVCPREREIEGKRERERERERERLLCRHIGLFAPPWSSISFDKRDALWQKRCSLRQKRCKKAIPLKHPLRARSQTFDKRDALWRKRCSLRQKRCQRAVPLKHPLRAICPHKSAALQDVQQGYYMFSFFPDRSQKSKHTDHRSHKKRGNIRPLFALFVEQGSDISSFFFSETCGLCACSFVFYLLALFVLFSCSFSSRSHARCQFPVCDCVCVCVCVCGSGSSSGSGSGSVSVCSVCSLCASGAL